MILIVAILTQSAQAQVFKAGLKFGTNVNKLSGYSFSEKFSFGYHAGVYADIKLSKRFSLQPEVVFNQVNYDTSSQFRQLYQLNASTISNIKLTYLSIPILLNYNVGKVLSLQAGPQYGILINQNENLLQNGKAAFKSGDFSMLGGVQLKLANFRIYGRYAIGLQNLNDIDNRDSWKNQSIQVGIGLNLF
ncbi:MAG: hypothetical protein RLY16_1513 [Bacteroidota bacterium]|jgi:hypothetical protein